ncbi:MAG: helix-turn-helix domain-containing protein [Actinomycetota bacterium]
MDAIELTRLRRMLSLGTARLIRVEAGLSLSELARAVGVDRGTIWRWETGRRRPRGRAAERFLTALEELSR